MLPAGLGILVHSPRSSVLAGRVVFRAHSRREEIPPRRTPSTSALFATMASDDYLLDLVGPVCCFAVLYGAFYVLIHRLRSNTRIVNAKSVKRLDFIWLAVAVVGLFFAGFDTIRTNAIIRGTEARADYRWAFDELKDRLIPLPVTCGIHYTKTKDSPSDFDDLVKQQRYDCDWARQAAALLSSIERPNFEDYRVAERPPLKKAYQQRSNVQDILGKWESLATLHERAVKYSRVAESAEAASDNKRNALYLLAFALAIRFVKVHGELMLASS
ncbi:MAG TPA: hypothetical protein VGD01_04380 [Candidatus Elarobacter sp.]|jgi:hypothetical protein